MTCRTHVEQEIAGSGCRQLLTATEQNTFQLYLEFQGWHRHTRRGLQTLELILQVPQPGIIDIILVKITATCLSDSWTVRGTYFSKILCKGKCMYELKSNQRTLLLPGTKRHTAQLSLLFSDQYSCFLAHVL